MNKVIKISVLSLVLLLVGTLQAKEQAKEQIKPDVHTDVHRSVHKSESVETININANMDGEKISKETHSFCSTDQKTAKEECAKWLSEQKKALKNRLLTSHCSSPKFLYGKEQDGCMAYLSTGEISFLLNKK
ncbi:MAG: hypothetical protein KA436_01850 [Oligoflexales bacterium]|nr:hypothetical protein [Oligoflexales bacterium]